MKTISIFLGIFGATMLGAIGADWPQFLGPDRNAVVPHTRPLAMEWQKDGVPRELWTLETGPGYGGAAIVAGVVYFLDRTSVNPDKRQDIFRAIDLETGKELWRYEYASPGEETPKRWSYPGSRSVPLIVDGKAYTVGTFGRVHCLDLATRKRVWKREMIEDFGTFPGAWGISQSPLHFENKIIIAPVSEQAGLVALDRETGETLWKSEPLEGETGYVSPTWLVLNNRVMLLMVTTHETVGLDIETGEILWRFNGWRCRIPIAAPVLLPDDRLFLTGGYGAGSVIIEIRETTGGKYQARRVKRINRIGAQVHQPILHEDHIYILSNENENAGGSVSEGLVCLNLDGEELWRTEDRPNFERGPFLLAEDRLYILHGATGDLYIVDPDPLGYEELDRTNVIAGKEAWAPMALSEQKLVIRNIEEMKCLDIGTR